MTLDLKSPDARQVLERLVKWADVLIVNTPHAPRKKLGLEYDDVVGWNPRLIYADLTGFGEKGPDANLPGFDITSYWARSGLLSMTRDAGAPPTWPVAGSGMRLLWAYIPQLSQLFIVVSALARARMSRRHSSLKVSGQQAFRFKAHCVVRKFSGYTIEGIPQMRQ